MLEIEVALGWLASRLPADAEALGEEQVRFTQYWEGCTANQEVFPVTSDWWRETQSCLAGAFEVRSRELNALVQYHSLRQTPPADHWRDARLD